MRLIPLSLLHSSPRNVRKTGETSIRDLAASIAAHGLLQGLVVTEAAEGRFEVEAGSRRLRALLLLRQEEKIPEDFLVPCRVIGQEEAQQVGLAENVVREAMHPADQFEAFFAISLSGLSDAEIAARYGTTERHVAQILRLARVSPKIMAEYKAGKATLEQLQALAVTDDVAAQEKVWNAARSPWQRRPDELRRALTEKEISVKSALGTFVGLQAYEKAGGAVRYDLFSADNDAFLMDPKLVRKLAQEKLDALAAKLQTDEGWAWAEGRIEFDHEDKRKLGSDGWSRGSAVCSAAVKASAGVVVTIGRDGKAEIWRQLVRPEDKKALAAAAKKAGKSAGAAAGKPEKKPGELSFAAIQRLQAEATGIIQAEVADSPRTALALLVVELARKAFYQGYGDRQWVHISRDHTGRATGPAREILDTCAGAKRMEAIEEAWRKKLPSSKAGLLEWALGQEYTVLGQLLAFLVAREIDAVDGSAGAKDGVVALAAAAKVDLATEWRPTEEWLATLPKGVILAMLEDAAGKKAVAQVEKLAKGQLPAQALPLFPAGWLPKPLRGSDKARKAKPARGKAAAAGMD